GRQLAGALRVRAGGERAFDDPVFQTLVRENGDASAWGEGANGGGHGSRERGEFTVHFDPQGLEGVLRGVATGTTRGGRHRVSHDLGEPGSAGEGRHASLTDDG